MWSATDGLWALSEVKAVLVFTMLTIMFLQFNAAFDTGLGIRSVDRTDMVWIVWTSSNLSWILTELTFHDSLQSRYFSAALGFCSLAILVFSFDQFKARNGQRMSSLFKERSDCLESKLSDHLLL